ncbi:unnamed protein product [Ambrosiozyma monospora]|uniref:Unnamed protein product n=1 Tax=Ambrosiozyma monospora TaxID=43982 RepID=A0ACB5UAX7_AMBMO|nr:unnamed protein product [Ambrosiozyma monospora]
MECYTYTKPFSIFRTLPKQVKNVQLGDVVGDIFSSLYEHLSYNSFTIFWSPNIDIVAGGHIDLVSKQLFNMEKAENGNGHKYEIGNMGPIIQDGEDG